MSSIEEKKFLRLIKFSYDVSLEVLRAFTELNFIPKLDEFLNNNKHVLFHLLEYRTPCCACSLAGGSTGRKKELYKEQFDKLFNVNGVINPGHYLKDNHQNTTQHCICRYSARSTTSLIQLDISLISILLRHCVSLASDEVTWLTKIKKIRDKLAHSSSTTGYGEPKLDKWWTQMEGSVLGLASKSKLGPYYTNSVQSQISMLKRVEFGPAETEQILHEMKLQNQKIYEDVKEEIQNTSSKEHIETRELICHVKEEILKELKEPHLVCRICRREDAAEIPFRIDAQAIEASCQVTGEKIDEEMILSNLQQQNIEQNSDFNIKSAKRKCIILELSASPDIFQSNETFRRAILSLITRIVRAGELNSSIPYTIELNLMFNTPLTQDEVSIVSSLSTLQLKDETEQQMQTGHDEVSIVSSLSTLQLKGETEQQMQTGHDEVSIVSSLSTLQLKDETEQQMQTGHDIEIKMAEANPANYISTTSNSDVSLNIVPGLTGLNLNILHSLDMHIIENAKQMILKSIKKEHPVVANVQKTMIALLRTKIPIEKREARIELEQIVEKSPKNLNALADLETLYTDLNRSTDADHCRRKIENLLKSERDEDVQIRRTCLLEQGYAILIERTIVNENTIELGISDLRKILTTEHEHSDGNRRKCLERGIHHQKQVLRNIHQANEENTTDGHLIRKGSSLHKFEMAENLSSMAFPHPVWNHYYAKALNQYYDSLDKLSKYQSETGAEMAEVTIKAVRKFWKFAQLPPNADIETFIARSLAYIGQILVKRNRKDSVQSQEDKFDFIRHPEFQRYLNDPLKALREAHKLKSNDVTVLNRYGRSLWNCSFVAEDKGQRITYLQQADDILTDSIRCDPDLDHWFAYSTRMMVRLHLGNYLRDEQMSKYYLENAEKDGRICFKSKNTRRDMTVLAEVCQKLSKFPKINRYGPEFVKSKNYLHKALDYLFYAAHLSDPIDFHWTNTISACLFDLGEYEQAIDWQRKAWFISSPEFANPFYILCMYMLTRFERDNKLSEANTKGIFLKEFIYTLNYAKEQYDYKDITPSIEKLYRYQRAGLFKLLQNIIVENVVPVNEEEKAVLIYYLDMLIRLSYGRQRSNNFHSDFQRLRETLKNIIPVIKNEYLLPDIFKNTSLKPLSKGIKPWSKGFKFDFFVCHSHKDGDWVNNILLRHLEGTFDEHDNAFKGCIADRDFIPGKSVLDNIVGAISQSSKVILVLTPHFVSSMWCHFEADQAIIQSLNLDPKENRNFVIPVKLKDCKIPDKLAHLNYSNMTVRGDSMREMWRLKKALLLDDN